MKDFCICAKTACPLHPAKHDNGCPFSTANNLRVQEISRCFASSAKEDADINAFSALETSAHEIIKRKKSA